MGSKGSSSSQSASSQSYTPAALQDLQNLFGQVKQTASIPYAPYDPNAVVAPLNSTQTQAISNIAGAQNQAQPYFDTAAGYATTGANPLDTSQISRYYNPFQQSVIDATTANMQQRNQEQEQQLRGNVTSQGGLGNERFYAAALPQLHRQQNLADNQTIAGLNAQNYSQALAAAQADRAAAGQGAFTFANLGTGAQGAQLAGSQAALQAGEVQQQNAQQLANAKFQEFMRQQGYPFQTTQFLTALGLPALQAQGGTQSGTSTSSGSTSSTGGIGSALGILGGLFGADGGRVPKYAPGGSVMGGIPYSDVSGYVPINLPSIAVQFPHFSNMSGGQSGGQQSQGNPAQDAKMFSQAMQRIKKLGASGNPFDLAGQDKQGGPYSDNPNQYDKNWNDGPMGGGDPTDTGGSYDVGSFDTGADATFQGGSGDVGMAGDFGGLDMGMAANGGRMYKRGGSIPFMVNGLIETAHAIKDGLHRMPSRHSRKGYGPGGAVDDDPISNQWDAFYRGLPGGKLEYGEEGNRPIDAFGWLPIDKGNSPLRNKYTSITGYEPGSIFDKIANVPGPMDAFNPRPGSMDTRMNYGKFIANQAQNIGREYPLAPESVSGGAQPVNDSIAEPVVAGIAAPSAYPEQQQAEEEWPAPRLSAASEPAPAIRSNPFASATRPRSPLGLRPNEIAGFNEATGAYDPSANQWLNRSNDGAFRPTGPSRYSAGATANVGGDKLAFGRQVYNYFIDKGLPPHQAAAIAGNMAWEGGGRSDLVNVGDNYRNSPRSPHSMGIAQWNDRLPALVSFAKQQGVDLPPGDLRDANYVRAIAKQIPLKTQLDFAWNEMQGPENASFRRIASGSDVPSAAAGAIGYHRPAGWSANNPTAGHGYSGRVALANAILRDQAGGERPAEPYREQSPRYMMPEDASLLLGPTPPLAPQGTGLLARMYRNAHPEAISGDKAFAARRRAMELLFQAGREQYRPIGTDQNTGHPLAMDARSGRAIDIVTGRSLTGDEKVTGVGASGRMPAVLQVAAALRNADPSLTERQSIEMAQRRDDTARNEQRLESLAAANARADIGYIKDPLGTLAKHRAQVGLPPRNPTPALGAPAAPGAPQSAAPGAPMALSATDPGWQQKYSQLPSGSEFTFTDKDGVVKRGRKP